MNSERPTKKPVLDEDTGHGRVRGLAGAKTGRDRTMLTPEVQTQRCVATEKGRWRKERSCLKLAAGLASHQGALPSPAPLSTEPPPPPSSCQSALGQTSPRHRGPKGQRRLLPAGPPLRCGALPLQTNSPAGRGPYGTCHYRPSVARHPAQCGRPGPRFTHRQLPTEGPLS